MIANHRRRLKRSYRSALCAAALSVMSARSYVCAAEVTASWVPDSSGVWASTSKWTSNPNYPHNGHPSGTNYLAVINVTGPQVYTVTLNTSPIILDGLTLASFDATLLQSGGSFTPGSVSMTAGTYQINGSTSSINGATINLSTGITSLQLVAGAMNGGSATANGSGSLITVNGGFTFSGGATLQATNFGTVELQNGNFINNSNMPTGGADGTISVGFGATLDNTGVTAGSSSTLQAPSGGTLQLNNGTIRGGTVDSTGGTFLNKFTGTLDGTSAGGITLIGTLQEGYNSDTYLKGLINDPSGFTFTETPTNNSDYFVLLTGNTELSGVGTTTTLASIGGSFNQILFGGLGGTEQLTVDSGHTLLSKAVVQVTGQMTLINNGTIQVDGSGNYFEFRLNNGSSNTGVIEASNSAAMTLDNFDGGTFTNSATIKATNSSGITLINGLGSTVINSGTIEAINGASVTLNNTFGDPNGGTFTNSGKVLADGTGSSVLIVGNGFSNTGSGTIQATNGATVELRAGNFINNGLATAGAGSVFSIDVGANFDNTGTTPGSSSTLQPPSGGTLQLNEGMISGGTVNSTGGTLLDPAFSYGTLDGTPAGGITLIGNLQMGSNSTINLQGLINDPGGFTFDTSPASSGSYEIALSGNTELSGNASTTTIANTAGQVVFLNGFAQLTIDSGHTLLSQTNVQHAPGAVTLINNGTVQADGTNNQFYLALANDSSNAGLIEATNGAAVTLDNSAGNSFTNSGKVLADGAGSELVIDGNGFSNTGLGIIQANNGATVELQNGNFINNGFVTAEANSTFSIGGGATIDNTGATPGSSSTLQSPSGGTLQINGGTISGGTVNSTGGALISNGGTLDGTPTGGITLIGTMLNGFSATSLQGLINDPSGFTFDSSSSNFSSEYLISLSGNTEFSGNGSTTTLANSTGQSILLEGSYQRLTVDSGHTLLSQTNVQSFASPLSLINNGTVQADGLNNQFNLALVNASTNAGNIKATNGAVVALDNSAGGTFANSGTLEAASGGTLSFISANLTNTGTIALHGGTLITDVALAVGDGMLAGSGTINGDVTLDSDPSTLAFQIRSDTDFDSLLIIGNLFVAGDLEITLAPGAVSSITSSDTFDVLDANSLSGSFLDVADGQRLNTSDGTGSFLVNYGTGADADKIVLSDFQEVPEPASISLLALSGAGLLMRRRSARTNLPADGLVSQG